MILELKGCFLKKQVSDSGMSFAESQYFTLKLLTHLKNGLALILLIGKSLPYQLFLVNLKILDTICAHKKKSQPI